MYKLKRFVLLISANLIRILLYTTATIFVVWLVFSDPARIKHDIKQSGAYEKFVPSIIDANKAPNSSSTIPLDDQDVVDIINKAFPPRDLERKTNIVVDGVYAWLKGNEENVKFSVDFSKNKSYLGDELSRLAFERIAFMDLCSQQPETFDPFTTDCRPPNYDIFAGQEEFATLIKSSQGFLGTTELNQDNLPKNKAGQNIFEQYYFAPRIYSWLHRLPFIFGGLSLMTIFGVLWASPFRRKALAKLGKNISGISLTLILTPLIFGYVIPWFTKNYSSGLGGSGAEVILNDILDAISKDFDRLMILVGSILLIIGVLIVLGEKMTRSQVSKYRGIKKRSGLASSNGKISEKGLGKDIVPLQSSEAEKPPKPKSFKKSSRYKKIPL